jgi:phosphoglucosamine mutase
MPKLFGTDGIRGEAYRPPLDRSTVIRVGQALAKELAADAPRILIGRDTRASGPDIESWLTAGILAAGGRPTSAGVTPTPAIAFLTQRESFDAGVVISASHNPFRDNGIKIFSADGVKSSEALENAIENEVNSSSELGHVPEATPSPSLSLEKLYSDHLAASLGDVRLPKLKIALDCANGAGYRVGPKLLASVGLDVVALFDEPNGENINRDCGSTAMAHLTEAVVDSACDLGAALDGDGDRVLFVNSKGNFVDGDAILLLCARRLKKEGRLSGDAVVATVMSNMALEVALADAGITLLRTQVGDKFVAHEMAQRHIVVGGEQSGHIIFSDYASTGDGLLTLMQVLRVVALEQRSFDELSHVDPFPQVLVNVRVRSQPDVRSVPEIARAIVNAEKKLAGRGRVLVRYSGTEPLLRIMMEGPEETEISSLTQDIRAIVEASIGGGNGESPD